MSYSHYPIKSAEYFKVKENTNVDKERHYSSVVDVESCLLFPNFREVTSPTPGYGYYKPVVEKVKPDDKVLVTDPRDGTSSLWNNLTKRKSVVKDNKH